MGMTPQYFHTILCRFANYVHHKLTTFTLANPHSVHNTFFTHINTGTPHTPCKRQSSTYITQNANSALLMHSTASAYKTDMLSDYTCKQSTHAWLQVLKPTSLDKVCWVTILIRFPLDCGFGIYVTPSNQLPHLLSLLFT